MAAVLALMLAACNVESDFLSQEKNLYTETITVSANRDGIDVNGPDGTRATLTEDNTLKSVWEAGDQLTVWTGNDFSEDNMSEGGFTLDSGAGTNSATFTGKVKSTSKPNKTTVLTAVVDNDDDAVVCSSGTTAALDFSEQESCTTSTVLRYDALWAQATYDKRDFHFAHTMSFVEWTIHIKGITAATTCDITLSATDMQNKAALNLAEGKLEGTNEGDIKLTDVNIDDEGLAVVYVALFPGAVTSKMTAVVTMADGKVTTGQVGTFESFTFVANTLYTAAWTFGEPVEPTYTFTATSPAAIAYNTTTGNYTVKSYATVGSTQQPVAWEVTKYEYSDDGGTTWTDGQPAWFTSLSKASGTGSTSGESGTASVAAATLVTTNPVTALLQSATSVSNYNLSNSSGGDAVQNTANCYVISAPGTYKLPLVYGNGIKDGATNSSSIKSSGEWPFVNSAGSRITQPYILSDSYTGTVEADLVWSDINLTKDDLNLQVSGSGQNAFLTFEVSSTKIQQGNAVVGIKDNNGYLWSWHLWFTDSGALSTIAFNNASNETQYFTRDNLGFAYDSYNGTTYTTPRRVRVTVTQTGSGQTASFEVIQNPGTSNVTFHDTKYQFGRKDALSGSSVGAPTIATGETTYADAIKNPGTFYTFGNDDYDWCKYTYENAWAVNNTSQANSVSTSAITKSVYDPCPVGFKMPGSNAFTGFSTSNGTWANKGYTFTDGTINTSVFFPAAGYLEASNGTLILGSVGEYGCFWSAVPNNASLGWGLFFHSRHVGPQTQNGRFAGRSVRPVQSN